MWTYFIKEWMNKIKVFPTVVDGNRWDPQTNITQTESLKENSSSKPHLTAQGSRKILRAREDGGYKEIKALWIS